jgi:hypothetical protein
VNHYILGGPAMDGEHNILDEETRRVVARCVLDLPDIIFPEHGDISDVQVKITWVKED